ncbi:MAG: cupin domain-containing protein [Actinomycetota bacterium]
MTDAPSSIVLENLLEEVQIPDDGTLSRVVYSDERIRVVAFAFDTGQELTDHTAGVPAVVQVIDGRLRLTLGERTVEVGPASWVHMEAHLTHAVVALEPSVMLLTLQRGG